MNKFRIVTKPGSIVGVSMPEIVWKFHQNPFIMFWDIALLKMLYYSSVPNKTCPSTIFYDAVWWSAALLHVMMRVPAMPFVEPNLYPATST